ncbi:3' terminal RNA ribose 2'-O-methyltransferase Hen1 [Kribbella solani]|uniref:3' terminal RNA ribose 2'-O-methyltransferase Hen1 n=1 Tax=Kribbella solani TaxID=236067 RepID=UPI0029B533C4|nr:3' terminal RNA ribose 2'-O-methyltransferase Hen1 [Kribbella solani]MDX2970728.1 3' terminal RNA ribose 2'-O-methyltransferase Hen1 [Kribbella solani]MDX3003386.1 3' terminal RNA ribose 2'-O-methyltransferase Hen1 [Kribbella solani]
MFLTLSTDLAGLDVPASDFGFLLHKNPARPQTIGITGGSAHVFYPEATGERCTAAVLLEIDPIGLVRSGRGKAAEGFTLGQYVNDRPYAASSLLAVALGKLFRTAMNGRCDARPELAARPLPLEIHVPALPCNGGAELAERFFAPLGWTVDARPVPLDPEIPAWGDSRYVDLRLTGVLRLADALNHLYVMLPVLDDAKHYWVGSDEVDKLVKAGEGWLAAHPEKDLISRRYLAHRRYLADAVLERLAEVDGQELAEESAEEGSVSLAVERRTAVAGVLRELGARRIADIGCGEGALAGELLKDPMIGELIATDVSARALISAKRRLRYDDLPDRQRDRLRFLQSSVTYSDERLAGLDAVVLMEVVEHVDPPRLPALARSVFQAAHPAAVVMTTPNSEYNVLFQSLPAGKFRHPDHRFEWTRAEFEEWARGVASTYGYTVEFRPVGAVDPAYGAPTQLALFRTEEEAR